MRRLALLVFVCIVRGGLAARRPARPEATPAEPFKLGTFESTARRGSAWCCRTRSSSTWPPPTARSSAIRAYPALPMPDDMRELIGQYKYGLKYRLYEIVNDVVTQKRVSASPRPGYIHDVKQVRTLAPLMPGKMLMAAVNFYSHVGEGGSPEEQKKALEARRAAKGIPYLYIKPTEGVIIGNGDNVVLPWGRDRIDWEVELATVIGRAARYVPAPRRRIMFSAIWLWSTSPTAAAARPAASAAERLVRHERPGHVRADGPVDRPERVLRRPDGEPEPDAERQRQGTTKGQAGDMIHSVWE